MEHTNLDNKSYKWVMVKENGTNCNTILAMGTEDALSLSDDEVYKEDTMKEKMIRGLDEDHILPTDRIYTFNTLADALEGLSPGDIVTKSTMELFGPPLYSMEACEIAERLGNAKYFDSYKQLATVVKMTSIFNTPYTSPIATAALELYGDWIHYGTGLESALPDRKTTYGMNQDYFEESTYNDYSKDTLIHLIETNELMTAPYIKYVIEGITCLEASDVEIVEMLFCSNMYNILDFEKNAIGYKDLPLIFYLDAVIQHVTECCQRVDNQEGVSRMEHLARHLAHEFHPLLENGFNPNQRNMNEWTPADGTGMIERETMRWFYDLDNAVSDEELTECFMQLATMESVLDRYESVAESQSVMMEGKTAREVSRKAEQGVRKATRKTGGALSEIKRNVKRALDPMEKFITATTDKIKATDEKERRDIIMKGGSVPKVLRWLKRSIPIAAGLVAGQLIPVTAVLSAVAFLGWICTDRYMDKKTRTMVLRELEDEIQICNEKIEDSRGDDNKQKKYELMRIRNKLTRTSEKIRLGLKY